jgi:hypothetical protein
MKITATLFSFMAAPTVLWTPFMFLLEEKYETPNYLNRGCLVPLPFPCLFHDGSTLK